MPDSVSLYNDAGRAPDSIITPIAPGDLVAEQLISHGERIELEDGRRLNETELEVELVSKKQKLTQRQRLKLLRETYKSKGRKKKPAIKRTTKILVNRKQWLKNAGKVGQPVGKVLTTGGAHTERPIVYSAGPIQIGTDNYVVCVCPGHKHIFLGRNGRILMLSGNAGYGNPRLPDPVRDPSNLTDAERELWGDTLCRQVVDLYTSADTSTALGSMCFRYGQVLRAHCEGAVVDMAAVGIERSMMDYVRAADRTFTEADLAPKVPTIKHALYMALALDLAPDVGTMLIEYAGFMELKLPVFQRETAYSLYLEARRALGILCPQWVIHGKATNWKHLETSVAELMRLQFYRLANDAHDRGLTFEAVLGMRLSLTQIGQTAVAGSYINRSFRPDVGLGILNELRNIREEDIEVEGRGEDEEPAA